MKENKTKKLIYNMVFTAVFAALCFVGTYIAIPCGISKVHLGNLVCIIAGLLCGGMIGGLSGGIGMGLNDIAEGYGPDTVIRTFIVKFLLGFIVGVLFRAILKKNKKANWIYDIIIGLFTIVFILFLVLYITKGTEFTIGTKTFKNSLFLVISLGVMALFFLGLRILSGKIKVLQQYVLISTSIAMVFNIVAEFTIKIPFKMLWASMTFEQAFIYATTSLPGALITAIITIILITFIYCPIYFATAKINKANDVYEDIQKITSWKDKQ